MFHSTDYIITQIISLVTIAVVYYDHTEIYLFSICYVIILFIISTSITSLLIILLKNNSFN